jgi:HlyD family secretion protein
MPAPEAKATPAPTPPLGIACIGRIQSEDGPIYIGARSLSGQPSLVAQLLVREGGYIKAGQVVAILNSRDQLEAAARQAEARIKLAEAQRDQVKAGAKTADVAAQQEEIARLEIEREGAQTEFNRIQNLFKEGLVSQSVLDQSRLTLDTKPKLIAAAKERLRGLTEIRQIDVDVATANVQNAMADAERARSEADAATVRASYSGRVEKIHAWEGQEVGSKGILEMAKVARMYVIAEVAETDISRVKVGQAVTVSGDSFAEKLDGKVVELGRQISRNSMVLRDPVSLTDARIVEVKILLDHADVVKNLIGGQVEVRILP